MRSSRVVHPFFPLLLAAVTIGGLSLKLTTARAQSAPPNPQSISVVPLRPLAPLSTVPVPSVPELNQYVASQKDAIGLGKALFWDMQTGSDGVQACATCHFNAGADSRGINQVSPGLKSGDGTFQVGPVIPNFGGALGPDYKLNAGHATDGSFGGYHDGDFPLHKQLDPDTHNSPVNSDPNADNDVVSSQGVFSSDFSKVELGSGVDKVLVTSDSIFSFPDPSDPTGEATINTRRVEPRNTPTVVNAVYNFRNFWDGRAQNICNGANPFGDRDTSSHFYISTSVKSGPKTVLSVAPKLVRLHNSSLCSQSLGPPTSVFEMSANGRNFREIGRKLLSVNPLQNVANTTPLGKQNVDPTDSVLGSRSKGKHQRGLMDTYAAMIQRSFLPQWWNSPKHICVAADNSEVAIDPALQKCPAGSAEYTQMEYNFSVFWGISIQLYEGTLRADRTPFDQHLAKQNTFTINGNGVQNQYSIQLLPNIVPYSISIYSMNPQLDQSDQLVFSFDDGSGSISQQGQGLVSGSFDYASGAVNLFFEQPPNQFPIVIKYSVGSSPLTKAQLHGLLMFNTKGRCVFCHGGPELTNASVGTVSQEPLERMIMGDLQRRVYDTGFYNIGVRPGAEDISLHDFDPFSKKFSLAEMLQDRVCNDPSYTPPMIPGRLGEGIAAAPLSCFDDIASIGNFKAPGLRNVALTAPYFHNGGQLTLEQVVEFYNRGGDFPDGFDQKPLMDANIQALFLTQDEKADLVDFLRNALTDSRTVSQKAPFDHPQIFLPNGHPMDGNGTPMLDAAHPGQAMDSYITIPEVGSAGGPRQKTFLEQLLSQ